MLHSCPKSSPDPFVLLEKYYHDFPKIKERLLSHGKSVYSKCEQIAMKHPEYNINMTFIFEVSYLHDIGVFMTNVPAIDCYGTERYVLHGHLGGEILRKEGYEEHAKVCERHTAVGIDEEDIIKYEIPLPLNKTYCAETIEEKLLMYCDKFYTKENVSYELSMDEIRFKVAKKGDKALKKLDNLIELFK
ncbi:HD domain-containing protein [Entamoeba marina]